MSTWGNNDNAANSVLGAAAQVNLTPNTGNQTVLFGNVTASAFITGATIGQFGVDATEMGVSNGSIVSYTITNAGSGYSANAAVTVSGNATSNATAGATGRITSVNVTTAGSGYTTIPTVAVAAPSATIINALTAVSNTNDTIAITTANSFYLPGDRVTYTVAAGNTAIGGLANSTLYFIQAANTTTVKLAATQGGAAIDLTASVTETGHSLTGETATAVAALSGSRAAAHAGWVLRTVGTGGRAGRVQEETLVAMGSMAGDAEDTIMKDA